MEQESGLIKLVKHLFNRQVSTFIIIFGRRGSGKTDMSFLIAEILYFLGIIKYIATNVEFEGASIPIVNITNLDDLKSWCIAHPGKKLFLFDELGRTISRRSPMSSLNVALINEFQILRKYKLSIVACTVNEKYTDNAILGQDVLDGVWTKPNWKNPKIALYDDLLENIHSTYSNIPKTSIKFNTWSSAPFTKHGKSRMPAFKDKDLEILWKWANGAKQSELVSQPNVFHRIARKFLKDALEKADYTLQKNVRE